MATHHLETEESKGPEVRAPWRLVRRGGGAKVAFSLKELVGLTSEFSIKHAPNCTSKVIRTEADKYLLVYRVTCGESYSDPKGHVVRLKFDFKRLKDTGSVDDLDVRVSCSCVAPDTWVRMADGTEKMIKDVRPGDMVFTHKGRARKVTHVTSRPAKPGEVARQMSVAGYREPLTLSEDHPVAVVRGAEVCGCGCGAALAPAGIPTTHKQHLAMGWVKGHHKRPRQEQDYSQGRALWRTAPQLWKHERLLFPRFEVGHTHVSPELASLAGYYAAEGCLFLGDVANPAKAKVGLPAQIAGRSRYIYGCTFSLHQDEGPTLAADIQAKVHKLYPEARINVRKSETHHGLVVEVMHAALAAQLYALVGYGSATKRLADEVITWDADARLALVSSWALGDGHFAASLQSVATTSRDLAAQMATLLNSLGVQPAFTYWDQSGGRQRAYRLSWSYRMFPQLVATMLPLMREAGKARVIAGLQCSRNPVSIEWGGGYLRHLEVVEEVPAPEEFYDLTVDEDASFIANGILVHNCPAFLFYGAQWNLSTGDALYGAPRPLLKAPTDPKRYQFIVCKHVRHISDRIQPVLDRMLAKHRTKQDEVLEAEKQKQIDVVKQQTEQDTEAARQKQLDALKDRAQKETDAEMEKLKGQAPKPSPVDDLDAMPDDLTTLGLPAKPKRGPIVPKAKPPEPPKALPENLHLVDDEDMDTVELPAGRKRGPMHVKVVEDDDDTTVILPGVKRRRVDLDLGTLPAEEAVEERGRKAPKRWADTPLDRPGDDLPPDLQLVEDDADDQVTKINRLKARMAALVLAQEA